MTVTDRIKAWFTPVPERPTPPKAEKAVTALGPYASGITLSSLADTPQRRAEAFLRAYRVGWFYKAGRKIADDVSSLDWSVSDGDAEEGEREEGLPRPDLRVPLDSLPPIDQFMRLLERPNPNYTGRQLLRKTQVRLDFAGAAAWWLEGGEFGLPTAIYGISPARMWESRDKAGNLIGWVMDADSARPVPFAKESILWFTTGNATDDEVWGTSVVEAVYSQVPLTDLIARHTADVLTTGGRLAGMLWPKNRALTEEEFADAQRAWRSVASDPNAGRRLLIYPEPMEYAAGASTPAEIGIPELAVLNRDEILTAFPMSPYMLGVPTPGGLNSGEVRREDRRDYWEGTIHPRADLLEETIHVGLLSRYEEVTGTTYDFEIEEPNLDDAPMLLEKAGAFRSLVSIGLDPKETLSAVGLDHIKWNGLPALLDPEKQAEMAEQAQSDGARVVVRDDTPRDNTATQQTLVGKGIEPEAVKVTRRDDVLGRELSGLDMAMRSFLAAQRGRIADRVRDTFPKTKAERKALPEDWWDGPEEDRLLTLALSEPYRRIGRGALQVVANTIRRVVLPDRVDRVLTANLKAAGSRITGINEVTRQAVADVLTEGVRRGYSIPQLVDGVPGEGFPGVRNATMQNGAGAFDELRAETIARTETMTAYNDAAIRGYGEFGVREVQAIDGDKDAECAARDGNTYSVDDALNISDHPNGTLDWVPIIPGA